jgi:phage terminase large subunit-like protein
VSAEDWDRCTDPRLSAVVSDPTLPVFVGIDAGLKHDHTALLAVTFDETVQQVRLVRHRIFHPSPAEPLDFEGAIELTIKDWMRCFAIRQILFDPWQMQATAQRLQRIGVPIKEFPQTVPNLTSIGQNLFDLIKGGNLAVYHSDQIRQAVLYAVAKETPRGWRIAKEKASHKIDAVIALAMACHAAVKRGYVEETAMATPIVTCGTEELSGPAANVRGVPAHYLANYANEPWRQFYGERYNGGFLYNLNRRAY